MSVPTVQSNAAYAATAPFYDDFAAGYDYEAYTATTERLASRHGVAGRRLLDVACGSGNSMLPALSRGWVVEGCDSSPEMLALAVRKVGSRARLVVADMRALPHGPCADLITCLHDSLNYLDDTTELANALEGFRRRLRPHGVIAFDLNTRHAYRHRFCASWSRRGRTATFHWRGSERARFDVTGRASAELEAALADGSSRSLGVHRQRHFSRQEVAAALSLAGLRMVGAHGLQPDGTVEAAVDEDVHTKAIFIAVACDAPERR